MGVKLGDQTGEAFANSVKQKVLGAVGAGAAAEGSLFDKVIGGFSRAVLGGGEALSKRRMEEEDRLHDLKFQHEQERQSPRFMSLEQLARSVQESQGKNQKDEAAARLDTTNQILRRIEEKKFIAGMA